MTHQLRLHQPPPHRQAGHARAGCAGRGERQHHHPLRQRRRRLLLRRHRPQGSDRRTTARTTALDTLRQPQLSDRCSRMRKPRTVSTACAVTPRRPFPVLGEKRRVIGVIATDDIVEAVDHAMGDDYAKLGGLSGEEDLHEPLQNQSEKAHAVADYPAVPRHGRVSSVVGLLSRPVVSQVALIVCFQSLILDMAGNVGTQSLAVTIRVLIDEKLTARNRSSTSMLKEMRVGFFRRPAAGRAASRVHRAVRLAASRARPLPYALCISGCAGVGAAAFHGAFQPRRHGHPDASSRRSTSTPPSLPAR